MTKVASLLPCQQVVSSRIPAALTRKYHSPRNTICRFYSNIQGSNTEDGDRGNTASEDQRSSGGLGDSRSVYHSHSHSLQDNRLKHRLRNGLHLTGVVSGQYQDTDHVEMFGLLGYDFLWADAEHSSASPDHVASMILAAERRGLPTIVRIGYGYQNIIGHIQKFLVAGAQGILLPQCETKEDVERIVRAVKFPPVGQRGLAGERWNAWGLATASGALDPAFSSNLPLAECIQTANENSIVGVLIENQKGLDALDDILAVPELDMVFFAPTDLSANMGLPGQIRHPEVLRKIEEAGQRVKKFNEKDGNKRGTVAVGTLALNAEDYVYWRERDFEVLCGVAQCMFVDGAKGLMDKIKDYEESRED